MGRGLRSSWQATANGVALNRRLRRGKWWGSKIAVVDRGCVRVLTVHATDEEQGRGEPRFEVQLDDGRAKRIEEEGDSSASLPGQAGDAVHGPFDCVSNPAPWWHQITVRPHL